MAHDNINIATKNFTVSLDGSSFFTMDHEASTLIEKSSIGVVIFTYFLTAPVTEVYCMHFDGFFFWTLERSGTTFFKIKKWEIDDTNLVNVVQEFVHFSDAVDTYDPYTFAVEHYVDTFDATATTGATSIDVVDGSKVEIGDRLALGPSTFGGNVGESSHVVVSNKVGNTLTVSSLTTNFSIGDTISFSRNYFVFSDSSQGSGTGGLYKFNSFSGNVQSLDNGNEYNGVKAAVFFKDNVQFVRAGEVIWLDPDSINIFKSQAIDNLDVNRGSYIETFDLAGYSDSLYRLEQRHVTYNDIGDVWEVEDWSPLFNYNTSNSSPEVYFVALKAEPTILHKFHGDLDIEDTKSAIRVTVLDQFRTPVSGQTVDFSSTAGSISPLQATTDSEGKATTEYTSDTSVGPITITADIP